MHMRVHQVLNDTRLELSEDNTEAHLVLCSSMGPMLNPLSLSTLREITQLARWLSTSDDAVAEAVKVVIIRGAKYGDGGSFTVGADVKAIGQPPATDTLVTEAPTPQPQPRTGNPGPEP